MINIGSDLQDNFEIIELKLNDQDIRNDYISLAIYENLFDNDLTLSIDFLETKNYLEILDIVEGSTLSIQYLSKYPPLVINMQIFSNSFECYKTERVKSSTQGKKVYRMHFITKEHHTQSSKLVSRAYRNQPTTDIIKSLFGFSESSGDFNITPSEDFVPLFTVPNINPWKAINTLCRDTFKQDSSDYIFYRNNQSYNCKPISELIAEPVKENYVMEQTSVDWMHDKSIEFRNIISYYQDKANFNTLDNLNTGLYGSNLFVYDFITKESNIIESEGKGSVMSSFDNKFIFDSNNYLNRSQVGLYRQQRLEKIYALSEERLILHVRTNTNITIGDTINIDIPTTKELSIIDASVSTSNDVRLSGKYLICKIKHELTLGNSQMIFECIRV